MTSIRRQEALPAVSREGLTVRCRRGRKRATGTRAPITLPQAANQRWSLDFAADVLSWGGRFRVLEIVDDFTREALALIVDSSIGGRRAVRALDALIAQHGRPAMIVSDNGTELTARAVLEWTNRTGTLWHYIATSQAIQNAFVESFIGGSATSAFCSRGLGVNLNRSVSRHGVRLLSAVVVCSRKLVAQATSTRRPGA